MEYNIFYITEDCNINCKYCYEKNTKNPTYMNWEQFKKQLKHVSKGDKVILYGGEPILNWILIERICQENITKDYFVSITTNGLLLTNQKLKFLIDNNIEVSLSFDGIKTTDLFRHKGITKKIFSLLLYCQKQKYINKITLSWVVHQLNIKTLNKEIDLILNLFPESIKKICLRPLTEKLAKECARIMKGYEPLVCHSYCQLCDDERCKSTIKPYKYFKNSEIIKSDTSGIVGKFNHFNNKHISVGYNRSGQDFFDILNKYNNRIHSYYFNPIRVFDTFCDPKKLFNDIKNVNTYNIDGNLMFNSEETLNCMTDKDIINITNLYLDRKNLNITSITVIKQATIDLLKPLFPDIKFNVSVRSNINNISDVLSQFNIKDIDCVNLGNDNIFNLELMNQLHSYGIKTKSIANLWCLYNGSEFGKKINKKFCNAPLENCKLQCHNTIKDEYNWINLTRQGFNKEFLPYFENYLDIIKLSTRTLELKKIDLLLEYWTTDKQQTNFYNCFFSKEIPDEFIKQRMICDHDCFECRYCEQIFNKYNIKILHSDYVM